MCQKQTWARKLNYSKSAKIPSNRNLGASAFFQITHHKPLKATGTLRTETFWASWVLLGFVPLPLCKQSVNSHFRMGMKKCSFSKMFSHHETFPRAEVTELHKGCKSPSFPSSVRKTTTKKTPPNTQTRSWQCWCPWWCWNNWKFAVQIIPHLSQLSKHSPHPQFQAVIHNFFFFNHIKDQGLKSRSLVCWIMESHSAGVRRDLKNHLIPTQEILSSGHFLGFYSEYRIFFQFFVWFRLCRCLGETQALIERKMEEKGKLKKKSIKKGEVCECDDFYDFSAPHTSFPTCLMSNQTLRELEKETTDLGWVGAANPTISCLWCDKPRLWDLQEH